MDKTTNDIYELLIQYIKNATGNPSLKVIVGNQRSGEPSGEYCTILMLSNSSVGLGSTEEVVDESNPSLMIRKESSTYEMQVSVQFHRGMAHEYARKLMHFPNTELSYYLLAGTNVAVVAPNSYRNLDDPLNDGWVPRSQLDLTLRSSTEYAETIAVIEAVDVLVSNQSVDEDKVEIEK